VIRKKLFATKKTCLGEIRQGIMNKEKSAVSVRLLSFRLNPGLGLILSRAGFGSGSSISELMCFAVYIRIKVKSDPGSSDQIKRLVRQKKTDKTGSGARYNPPVNGNTFPTPKP
jgi:hypothetical protein